MIYSKLGLKPTLAIGVLALAGSFLLMTVSTNPWLATFVTSGMIGFGHGLLIITAIDAVWSYFDQYRGRITGLCYLFYNLAAAGFGLMFSFLANSENVPMSFEDSTGNYFPEAIVFKTPYAALVQAVTLLILGIGGILMIS